MDFINVGPGKVLFKRLWTGRQSTRVSRRVRVMGGGWVTSSVSRTYACRRRRGELLKDLGQLDTG